MYAYGETITRLRADAATDPYSTEETALDWSDPASLEIADVAIAPSSASESAEAGRSRLEVSLTLYMPFGSDVKPLDRLVVRGDTYDVEGVRSDWRNPFTGLAAGSVVQVRREAG